MSSLCSSQATPAAEFRERRGGQRSRCRWLLGRWAIVSHVILKLLNYLAETRRSEHMQAMQAADTLVFLEGYSASGQGRSGPLHPCWPEGLRESLDCDGRQERLPDHPGDYGVFDLLYLPHLTNWRAVQKALEHGMSCVACFVYQSAL